MFGVASPLKLRNPVRGAASKEPEARQPERTCPKSKRSIKTSKTDMTDPVKKYKEEFGEDAEVPHVYLCGQDLIDAVDDAVERVNPAHTKSGSEPSDSPEKIFSKLETGIC